MTLKSPAIIYRNEEADDNIYMEIQNKLNIQINGGGKKSWRTLWDVILLLQRYSTQEKMASK